MPALVSAELADDAIVDITTIGARSGAPRRIEIWMLDVEGRYFVTGTPGPRHWVANVAAHPDLTVHLKRHAGVDLPAVGRVVDDEATRRAVLSSAPARWYRTQASLDELVAGAPMIEVTFAEPG